jgi:hypothetical protein
VLRVKCIAKCLVGELALNQHHALLDDVGSLAIGVQFPIQPPYLVSELLNLRLQPETTGFSSSNQRLEK